MVCFIYPHIGSRLRWTGSTTYARASSILTTLPAVLFAVYVDIINEYVFDSQPQKLTDILARLGK